jgi:mevalonate kinase
MAEATAPGKIILLGEHAVVYGRPAIAAPVWQVFATATVTPQPRGSGCTIVAHDLGATFPLHDVGMPVNATQAIEAGDTPLALSALLSPRQAGPEQPLRLVTHLALDELGLAPDPDWRIDLRSTIPIAGGLGSGAALCTALVRGIFAAVGRAAPPETVSRIVYQSERFFHGTPSGIDNTVIAYGTPIWFVRGQGAEAFTPPLPFTLAIADSGIRSPTKETVGDVRRAWEAAPAAYEARFDAIAALVYAARAALTAGDLANLGQLLDANHALLQDLGVSSATLDRLVLAARAAGALGAKLSGGGRGGNVIALVRTGAEAPVTGALHAAGAKNVILTRIAPAV